MTRSNHQQIDMSDREKRKRYRKDRHIGVRGPVTLYDGWDTETEQPVTFQVLEGGAARDAGSRARFQREFVAARGVGSPFVCRYLDFFVADEEDALVIITEPQKGMSLRSFLALDKELSLKETLAMALELAEGLADCHGAGVIHRDLNPDNILIVDGTIKIINFGLAWLEQATALTATGLLLTSPEQAPPEGFTQTSRDVRADFYAFGVVLWEMLTGSSPFTGLTIQEMIQAKMSTRPPSLKEVMPATPPWLEQLLKVLMAADPAQRPDSFSQIREILRRRRFPKFLSKNAEGTCFSCGHEKHAEFSFCSFCGAEDGSGSSPDRTLVLERCEDPKQIQPFLERITPKKLHARLARRLKHPPFAIATDLTPEECTFLEEKCQEKGCVTSRHHTTRFSFKLNTVILVLFLVSLYGFNINVIFDEVFSPTTLSNNGLDTLEELTYRMPNAQRTFWLIMGSCFLIPLIAMVSLIWSHFLPWYKIPIYQVKGWWNLDDEKLSGRAVSLIKDLIIVMLFGLGAFLCWLRAFVILSYLFIPLVQVTIFGFLIPIAIVFCLWLFIRPISTPVLMTPKQRRAVRGRSPKEPFPFLQPFRQALDAVPLDEYRDLLQQLTLCYISILELSERQTHGVSSFVANMQKEADQALRLALSSREEMVSLIQQKEKPFASERIRQTLNGLRVMLGGMQTTHSRLALLQDQTAVDDRELGETLTLLQHELGALRRFNHHGDPV